MGAGKTSLHFCSENFKCASSVGVYLPASLHINIIMSEFLNYPYRSQFQIYKKRMLEGEPFWEGMVLGVNCKEEFCKTVLVEQKLS